MWRGVAAAVVVLGGARPTVSAHIWRGGGVDECVHGSSERKERGNRKSEKWNKMEEEGDREGEQREKGTEREMYSLFSLPPFLHIHYSIFSVSTRFFGEAAD